MVKIACPECKTLTEYDGEIKEGKLITCSNPKCYTPSGKRRRIKVIPNMVPSDTSDTKTTIIKSPTMVKEAENGNKDFKTDTEVIPRKVKVIRSDTNKKPSKMDRKDNIPYISIKELVRSTLSRCKNDKWPSLKSHAEIVGEWLEKPENKEVVNN